MLLRMRSLPPKTTVRPENGTLKAVDGSDENAMRWFDMIQVSRTYQHLPRLSTSTNNSIAYYLEERTNAMFDPSDSRSLDLRHSAALLLPANS